MKPRPPKNRRSRAQGPTRTPSAASANFRQIPPTSQLVQIEKPIYGGAFLARIEGKAVFVPLSLPGEQARVHLVEEKRGYASAEVDEILTQAPERTHPPCPFFGPCGGCQYQHAAYAGQLDFKQAILRETFERGGVTSSLPLEVLSGEPWAYRNRIRLAFDAHGNPGYRGRRSHQIVPITECPIAAPLLIEAATQFAILVRELVPGFHPSEIALFCNHDESALLISVYTKQPSKLPLDKLALAIRERIPALSGMEFVVEGNSVTSSRTVARWGKTSLAYHATGFDYRVDHGAFFQVNRWLVDALVARVAEKHRGKLAWDLFAGVGLFARQLTSGFDNVIAVESALSSTAALAHNLAGTSGSAISSSTLEFLRRNRKNERPDLIVVDPPRTGLGPDVTSLLAEVAAPRLTYVSCDPATLARDLRALIAGGYAIDRLTMADLFPQTFHIETIVDLRRA